MAMRNTEADFYGRQEDEKILYVIRPHFLASLVKLVKVYFVAFVVFLAFLLMGSQIASVSALFKLLGLILGVAVAVIGTKIVGDYQRRNISYITDRRVVHFEPTTLFATNLRTLTWDEVVKVKTYPPNMLWKQLAIGNVVVHSRTPAEGELIDDIELKDVYYYRDLGNYIDKILFTYKQKPREVEQIKPFVPKPRGQRY